MELGVRVGLAIDEASPGQAVIPGRLLLDVVRSLPTDQLSLEYRSATQDVEVVAGPSKFHLRTLPPEDFPKLPEAPAEGTMTVPTGAFVDTIARVARAASRDETRPHLTGVLVTASGRDLRMVATDSYRLAVRETQLEEPLEASLEANVPARTLQELGRIAGGTASETIGVAALENQVVFTVDDVVLSSRLVEGRFPNYQQLLPEAYEHELRVSRDELLEVVRRVGLLAQKNAPLRLSFSEGTLDVSAQTPDVGEASESLPVPFAGEPLEIGFNPEFFRDGLESAESEELILKLISPLRPGLIQSGEEGSDFLYLVMPIRLNVVGSARRAGHPPRAARLPQLRGGRACPAAGARRGRGSQRRRQDQPARGRLLRLHRRLAAHVERARARAPRRDRRARGDRDARRRGDPQDRGRLPARRGQAPARRWARRPEPRDPRGAPARERVPARAAGPREGIARRSPGPRRPGGRRPLARPRGHARGVLACARSAQRPARPHPCGRLRARRPRRLGCRARARGDRADGGPAQAP